MSTKIYHGYRLPITKVRDLFAWQSELRVKFESAMPHLLNLNLSRSAIRNVDLATLHRILPGEKEYVLTTADNYGPNLASETFRRMRDDLTGQGEFKDDYIKSQYKLTVTVHYGRKHLLAIVFANSKFARSFWESNSGAVYYGYWDNSDPDPKCSNREWSERKREWDYALPGPGVPANCGFTLETQEPVYYLHDARRLLPEFPSYWNRAREAARYYLTSLACLRTRQFENISDYVNAERKIIRSGRVENLASVLMPHLIDIRSWKQVREFPIKFKYVEEKEN